MTEDEPSKRGPKKRGNAYRVMVFLTAEEHAALIAYCERENVTHAEAVRRGLRALGEAR